MGLLRLACKAWLAGLLAAVKLACLFVAPVSMVWFNQYVAESQSVRINQYERDSALALLGGQALSRFDQMNERLFLRLLIENMDTPFETIALGSSRVLQLTANTVGSDSFYNFGVSGADYRDVMNTFYLLEQAGKLPQNMIIGLDPWLLRDDADGLNANSDAELFDEFLSVCLGRDTGWQPAPEAPEEDNLLKLADPAAFRQSMDFYTADDWQPTAPQVVEDDVQEHAFQAKMPDGSVLYPLRFRTSTLDEVEDRARQEAVTFLRMEGYAGPSRRLADIFMDFVQYAQARGVNVIFLMVPYHPTVYRYACENESDYPGFFQMEPWFTQLAQQLDIPVYGSYNPYVTGNSSLDFYDGLHIRREQLSAILPPLRQIRADRARGAAKSPWMLGRERVQEETARELVALYYAIGQPHYLVLDSQMEVYDMSCYIYHRYSTEDEGVLYARYAVSIDEGIVLRDDDSVGWMVDLRFPK